MSDTAGSAAQHRGGLGRSKRRRLDPDRGELSLEDEGINGKTNVNDATTTSASPSNERVELCPGHKTTLIEVNEPSDSEQTESNLVETRGPDVAQYSQLRTPKNAFSARLSEPVQPDKTYSVLPSGNRSQSTNSTLSALATGNNNQSPSAPSSTDSGSVAHEVQPGWQPMQRNVRWPRSGRDDHQGNRSYISVPPVQPFANESMGTEQPQDYRTGKSSIAQSPSEPKLRSGSDSHEPESGSSAARNAAFRFPWM